MGGAFDFVGDIIDTGANFLGDVGSTIGNVVGDVAGGIGDLVGNLDLADAAKAFIMSGGNPYAAAIAATNIDESLGFNPGSFMSGDFSDFGGGADIGGGGFNLSAPDFGGGLNNIGNFNIANAGSNLTDLNLGDIVDYGDYNQLGDAYDTTKSVLDNLGDLRDYGDYNQIGDAYDTTKSVLDTGIGGTIKGGLDTAAEWYKKYGNMAGTVGKLVSSYYAGQLSKQQQEDLNKKIQAEYDAYNAKKSQFASQIASGSLPKLNIQRGTYSPVRGYNPVYAANGGSIRGQYAGGGLTDLLASLTMPSMEDILGGYEKYGNPIGQLLKYGLSYGAGELSKKQQRELNEKLQAQYNKYNEDKAAFSDLISSGNLAKMNIQKGSTPVVAAARGGIMNLRPRVRSNLGIMGVNR
jgi:hypothetical protein